MNALSYANYLPETERNVTWLLRCLHLYNELNEHIADNETRLLEAAQALAQEQAVSIAVLLRSYHEQPIISALMMRKKALTRRLEEISAAMHFDTPLIWMLYKYRAYVGTSRALATVAAFREHCSKPGYICTKRFRFLNERLRALGFAGLDDEAVWLGDEDLMLVIESPGIAAVMADLSSYAQWCAHEYYEHHGASAKWEDVAA